MNKKWTKLGRKCQNTKINMKEYAKFINKKLVKWNKIKNVVREIQGIFLVLRGLAKILFLKMSSLSHRYKFQWKRRLELTDKQQMLAPRDYHCFLLIRNKMNDF